MRRTTIAVSIVSILATVATAGINPNGPDLQSSARKCSRLGYAGRPELNAACIRAMRADYCGDGTAHTVAGTPINLYDRAGIQRDAANWRSEAEWTAHGASCVSSASVMRRGPVPVACSVPVRPDCGVTPANGTLVVTEVNLR